MIESTSIMTYKATLHMSPQVPLQNDSEFTDIVFSHLQAYLQRQVPFEFDLHRLKKGMTYKTESTMLLTAHYLPDSRESASLYWAAVFRVRDRTLKRRTWTTQIGLSRQSPTAIVLHIAQFYADYQVGMLHPLPEPYACPPTLIRDLLNSPMLFCSSGNHVLPSQSCMISSEDIDLFINVLMDSERTAPLVLITCPDLVSPSGLAIRTMGNLIVCWLDDFETYDRLCNALPLDLQFPWDSIKVFMPIAAKQHHHLNIPLSDITASGEQGIIEALCRAYCSCFTGDERRAFVCLDTIYAQLREYGVSTLRQQLSAAREDCQTLRHENAALLKEKEHLAQKLSEKESASSDTAIYEEMLNEALNQHASLKNALDTLTAQLYSGRGQPISLEGLQNCAEVNDLAIALHTYLKINSARTY